MSSFFFVASIAKHEKLNISMQCYIVDVNEQKKKTNFSTKVMRNASTHPIREFFSTFMMHFNGNSLANSENCT